MKNIIDKEARRAIEMKLGYRFKRQTPLITALIHPSYRHEDPSIELDNQRLEFLGDAVLGLLVASDIFERYPKADEGRLTHVRSQLTNRDTLAEIGRTWDLGSILMLGKGEESSGGRQRASNLTDAVEALIGAAYMDGGEKAARKIYEKWWAPSADEHAMGEFTNPKGELQEFCQKKWKVSPVYEVVNETGPAHARSYTCKTVIKGKPYGEGSGSNKRSAEMEAARATLRLLSTERLD